MLFCRLIRTLNNWGLRGRTARPHAVSERDEGKPADPVPSYRKADAIPDPPPAGGPVNIPPKRGEG